MNTLHENQKPGAAEEQVFIAKALAAAEKAEKISRIKRITFSVLALAIAIWLAIRAPGPQFDTNALLIILLFAVVVCTQKVLELNNKNARALLQAIAQVERQIRSGQ